MPSPLQLNIWLYFVLGFLTEIQTPNRVSVRLFWDKKSDRILSCLSKQKQARIRNGIWKGHPILCLFGRWIKMAKECFYAVSLPLQILQNSYIFCKFCSDYILTQWYHNSSDQLNNNTKWLFIESINILNRISFEWILRCHRKRYIWPDHVFFSKKRSVW